MSETTGSSLGGNTPPPDLTHTILEVDKVMRDVNLASTFPSSDVRPSYYTLLHNSGQPLYLFSKIFEDDDTAPQNFELLVEDEKVFLGIKSVLSRNEFAKYGAETAAKFMAWQDSSGFSTPDQQTNTDFVDMFSDFMQATANGQLEHLDTSTIGAALEDAS